MTTTYSLEHETRGQYNAVKALVAALNCDYQRLAELAADDARTADEEQELLELRSAANGCESHDDAVRAIHEDAIEVGVRSGWTAPGSPMEPEEFCILLATGGPAFRIIGGLDSNMEPSHARMDMQDWGTTWMEYCEADEDVLLEYARCFWFGE